MTNPLKVEKARDLLKLYDVNYENNVYKVRDFLREIKEADYWEEYLDEYRFLPEGFFKPIKEDFPKLDSMLSNYESVLSQILQERALDSEVLLDILVLFNKAKSIYDRDKEREIISEKFIESFAEFYYNWNHSVGRIKIEVGDQQMTLKEYFEDNKRYLYENVLLEEKIKQLKEELDEYKESNEELIELLENFVEIENVLFILLKMYYIFATKKASKTLEIAVDKVEKVDSDLLVNVIELPKFFSLPLMTMQYAERAEKEALRLAFEEHVLKERILAIYEIIERNGLFDDQPELMLAWNNLKMLPDDLEYAYKILKKDVYEDHEVEIENYEKFARAIGGIDVLHKGLLMTINSYLQLFEGDEE